jgi:hypothetical protein
MPADYPRVLISLPPIASSRFIGRRPLGEPQSEALAKLALIALCHERGDGSLTNGADARTARREIERNFVLGLVFRLRNRALNHAEGAKKGKQEIRRLPGNKLDCGV